MNGRCETFRQSLLRDFLRGGKLAVGERLPTTRELAARYRVSLPTVNKAVSLLASEGWVTKRHGSGIFVADPEQKGATARRADKYVGCIVLNLRSKLAHQVFEGVEHVTRSNHWALDVAASQWSVSGERRQIEMMRERGVAGVVLYPGPGDARTHEYLGKEFQDYPMVVVDMYQPWMKRPHVLFDNYAAGREMTHFLLERGRREIAFLKFDETMPYRSVDDRLAGYRRALEEAHVPFVPERVLTFPLPPNQKAFEATPAFINAVHRLLDLRPRPTAVVVVDDTLAYRAIRILRFHGVAVPQEIMVAGFDHLQEERWGEHFPSTQPDFVRMGERAAERLLEIIRTGRADLTEQVLPCPLIVPEQKERAWAANTGSGIARESLLQV